jgi:hypothetical protein
MDPVPKIVLSTLIKIKIAAKKHKTDKILGTNLDLNIK